LSQQVIDLLEIIRHRQALLADLLFAGAAQSMPLQIIG
jgi:hypothetical protein